MKPSPRLDVGAEARGALDHARLMNLQLPAVWFSYEALVDELDLPDTEDASKSAVISVPCSGALRTCRVAIGSGPGSRISCTVIALPSSCAAPISTPIRERIESIPIRLRLMPTSRSPTSLPGTSSAPAMKKAAEEKSPGTGTSPASRRSAGETISASPSRRIEAPIAASIRSVWSRVQSGSWIVVSPSASNPASSRQDLTWALATGIS
jgi:hypothetical protein